MYQIESKDRFGQWTPEVIGDSDSNRFETVADAEAMIAQLRDLGEEWDSAAYRVVEIA